MIRTIAGLATFALGCAPLIVMAPQVYAPITSFWPQAVPPLDYAVAVAVIGAFLAVGIIFWNGPEGRDEDDMGL